MRRRRSRLSGLESTWVEEVVSETLRWGVTGGVEGHIRLNKVHAWTSVPHAPGATGRCIRQERRTIWWQGVCHRSYLALEVWACCWSWCRCTGLTWEVLKKESWQRGLKKKKVDWLDERSKINCISSSSNPQQPQVSELIDFEFRNEKGL